MLTRENIRLIARAPLANSVKCIEKTFLLGKKYSFKTDKWVFSSNSLTVYMRHSSFAIWTFFRTNSLFIIFSPEFAIH